jgi:hypothetical protein
MAERIDNYPGSGIDPGDLWWPNQRIDNYPGSGIDPGGFVCGRTNESIIIPDRGLIPGDLCGIDPGDLWWPNQRVDYYPGSGIDPGDL